MLDRLNHYARVLGAQGLLAALHGKLTGRPRLIAYRRKGLPHPLLLRVPSTDVDAYRQIFLEEQYSFAVTRAPRVIIDAGANVGLASIYFANRFPTARIFAIECERSNFDLLTANARPYANVIPIHAALWNVDGEIRVVDPGLGHWGFMTTARSPDDPPSSTVRAVTLDTVRREHGIDRIDIMKIDIEGAEREVFDSSATWIGMVDTIIAELHDRLKPGCERSFSDATGEFVQRWRQGENEYVSKVSSCIVAAA